MSNPQRGHPVSPRHPWRDRDYYITGMMMWWDKSWALHPKILLKTPSLRYGPMSKKMKCKHHSLPAAWSERIANAGHCSLVFILVPSLHSDHKFIHLLYILPKLICLHGGEASEQAKASRQLQAKIIYTKNILKLNIVLTTVFFCVPHPGSCGCTVGDRLLSEPGRAVEC